MSSYFEEQRRKIAEEAQENIAMRLIRRGKDTLNEIAECSGLTLRRVQALAKTAAL